MQINFCESCKTVVKVIFSQHIYWKRSSFPPVNCNKDYVINQVINWSTCLSLYKYHTVVITAALQKVLVFYGVNPSASLSLVLPWFSMVLCGSINILYKFSLIYIFFNVCLYVSFHLPIFKLVKENPLAFWLNVHGN